MLTPCVSTMDQLLRILKSVFLNFLPLICDSMIPSEVTNAAQSVSVDMVMYGEGDGSMKEAVPPI